MREFVQFVRYFLYLLHFVRGVFVVIIVMMLVCSALFMHTEGLPVGESLYTTAITALTIGYGDITPKTIAGRTLSIVIGFLGVLFTGLIVAVATRALAHAVEFERKIQSNKRQNEKTLTTDDNGQQSTTWGD